MDKKLNWKEDIPKFNLPFAKILYMIYYFFNTKQLDNDQKKKLKEYVILDNSKIFDAFQGFEKSNSINDLLTDFKKIYKEEVQYSINRDCSKSILHKAFESTIVKNTEQEDDPNNIECLNSPMGGLMDRKKKKAPKNTNKKDEGQTKTYISRAVKNLNNDSN